MFDLLYYIKNFKPDSPHHMAAFNALAEHIPEDQLNTHAEWVNIYEGEPMELRSLNEFT